VGGRGMARRAIEQARPRTRQAGKGLAPQKPLSALLRGRSPRS
jgi:hypothetical protein